MIRYPARRTYRETCSVWSRCHAPAVAYADDRITGRVEHACRTHVGLLIP